MVAQVRNCDGCAKLQAQLRERDRQVAEWIERGQAAEIERDRLQKELENERWHYAEALTAEGRADAENASLRRELAAHGCVDCDDQADNDDARGYCPKHGAEMRDRCDTLEEERDVAAGCDENNPVDDDPPGCPGPKARLALAAYRASFQPTGEGGR
jgi:hypothetical protein